MNQYINQSIKHTVDESSLVSIVIRDCIVFASLRSDIDQVN